MTTANFFALVKSQICIYISFSAKRLQFLVLGKSSSDKDRSDNLSDAKLISPKGLLPPRDFFISKHEDILFVKSHEKIHQGF